MLTWRDFSLIPLGDTEDSGFQTRFPGLRSSHGCAASYGSGETEALAELLRPEPLPNGAEPEERVVLCGVSWARYLALDKALGDDRPGPRFYYLDGELEIITTSREHERVKKWIGGFLEIYFEKIGLEVMPHGQATMRQALKQAGAEPDESWCIGAEREIRVRKGCCALNMSQIPSNSPANH